MMCSIKSKGGLTCCRSMAESVRAVRVSTLYCYAVVYQAMSTLVSNLCISIEQYV